MVMMTAGTDLMSSIAQVTSAFLLLLASNFILFIDPVHMECAVGQRPCADGVCIPESWWCDNSNDCLDASDEKDCEVTCGDNTFQCDRSVCIPHSWFCDNHQDCTDGSDEPENCSESILD